MAAQHHQQQPQHSVSLADFVPRHHPSALRDRLARLPRLPLPVPRVLLYGPERCGRTSLLFQYAYHLASSSSSSSGGREVVILCDQAGLDQAPPLLPPGVDAGSDPALQRIKYKYVADLAALKAYGACLHLLPTPPAAIIVDGLAGLTANTRLVDKRAQDVAVTKAVAFLADGLEQLREQRSADVLLVVTDDTGRDGGLQNAYLLQRWFPLLLCITGGTGDVAGQRLTLRVAPQSSAGGAGGAVTYSLTQGYVAVEGVQEAC